jgi:phosphatidylglycerophosphate synthase
MRSADAVTLIRVGMIIAAAYLILIKFNPILILLIIAVAMLLDAVDGYFAVREVSKGKVSFPMYLSAASGNARAAATVKGYKKKVAAVSRYGARMDVAGDRAVEYILWITYTYVNVVPLFVIFIIVIRHSFVDAVMAARGTSSKMKTKFAQVVYSSNLFRGGINVVKFITFGYLAFAYIWNYPLWIGYVLTAILVIYILVRGAAELNEAYAE